MAVKYAIKSVGEPEKTAKTKGNYLRVHHKNTREVVATINGMKLQKAYTYLQAVTERQDCIPFRRYNRGVGRTPQANKYGTTQGRWPVKSVKFVHSLLKNAESNAEAKGLNVEDIEIRNICINQAPKTRRRTYRAHGRINPYQGHPCHVEIHLAEPSAQVPKADSSALTRPANKRQLAQRRITAARAQPTSA